MLTKKFRLIPPTVLKLIDGNQIQDGCRSRHLDFRAAPLIIERKLLRVQRVNRPQKIAGLQTIIVKREAKLKLAKPH
jgi:hypothetical protein